MSAPSQFAVPAAPVAGRVSPLSPTGDVRAPQFHMRDQAEGVRRREVRRCVTRAYVQMAGLVAALIVAKAVWL